MTDNVIRREVQRRDDPFGIPSCFYWTVDEVADWIDSIGYGKYKENFRSHFINGRKLLTVDACVLPRLGITNFGDILDLSKVIECLQHSRILVTGDFRPAPKPAPFRAQDQCGTIYDYPEPVVPWWEQPRHQTIHDYIAGVSRISAARLANQPQYFMGP